MSIHHFANLAKECFKTCFTLPIAGEFDAQSIQRLIYKRKVVKSLYEEIFGRTPKLDDYMDEIYPWCKIYDDVETSLQPYTRKILRLIKTKWLFVSSTDYGDEKYELLIPISNEYFPLKMVGVVPTSEPSSMFQWLESCLIVTNTKTKKETKWLLKPTESRSVLPLRERVVLERLEDIALEALVDSNTKRFEEQMADESKHTVTKKEVDLLRNWCLLHINCNSYNKKELRDSSKEVSICKEWDTFESFSRWADSHGYSYGRTLQRVDRTKDFDISNCEWIDQTIRLPERYYPAFRHTEYHSRSLLRNIPIEINGESKMLGSWEKESGIPGSLIQSRLRLGYKGEQLIAPIQKKMNAYVHKLITINNVSRTVREWAEVSGISEKTLISRIRLGWDPADLLKEPQPRKKSSES